MAVVSRTHTFFHIVRLTEQASCVVSGCTSVALLANTGVLASKNITASWWLERFFQHHIKGCKLDTSQILRQDGKYLTGGATSSFMLLVGIWFILFLGVKIAGSVSRHLLIN